MSNCNVIMLEGNCVREPIVTTTTKGTMVCTFSVANNRSYRVGESFQKEVSFFDVEAWGNQAEKAAQNCTKGRGVCIEGRLKQCRWEDASGKKCTKVKIVASKIDFKPLFTINGAPAATPTPNAPNTNFASANFAANEVCVF